MKMMLGVPNSCANPDGGGGGGGGGARGSGPPPLENHKLYGFL